MQYFIVFYIYNESMGRDRGWQTFAHNLVWECNGFPVMNDVNKAILERHGSFAGITGITQISAMERTAYGECYS